MAATDFNESQGEGVLTFEALHLALTRCMASHPPSNPEFQMHSDANAIAGLWGLMNYERTVSVPVAQVKPEVLAAYGRWGPGFPEGNPQ
ncbi:MAG: hypothetical protein M3Y55_05695 [Pseudomonadota bacterium]|nr:hypothetical protein [Pseudomonadota bacterium]